MSESFIMLEMQSGEKRCLYRHHTSSVSGQQPDWYWEWACDTCGWRQGNRDAAKLEAAVRAHVHEAA